MTNIPYARFHNRGVAMHNRAEHTYGTAFGEGDVLDIVLDDNGALSFAVAGVDQGVAFRGLEGAFVLACQPYMQGAARILGHVD